MLVDVNCSVNAGSVFNRSSIDYLKEDNKTKKSMKGNLNISYVRKSHDDYCGRRRKIDIYAQ